MEGDAGNSVVPVHALSPVSADIGATNLDVDYDADPFADLFETTKDL
jgi:hypothetical protein